MKKIGSLQVANGVKVTIYYDDNAKVNPFRIYIEYYKIDRYEFPTKHKKLIQKYGNLASCTAHIHNYVLQNDVEKMEV